MAKENIKTYFTYVVDQRNHTTYYLFNSSHRKGTWDNRFDGNKAIASKIGDFPKWYDGKTGIRDDSIYLDTPKNRDEQCFGEEGSTVIDCR